MSHTPSGPYPPISDYALVGDCHTAALIARDGSVDWFCPGRFDAPAVFCRLLDAEKGGYLRTAPTGSFSVERRYVGPTNVLESTFSAESGRVRVTDLMPVHQRTPAGTATTSAPPTACCAAWSASKARSSSRYSSSPLSTTPVPTRSSRFERSVARSRRQAAVI